MKIVNVEDYNGSGQFTKFVILNGNTVDNYGRAAIKTLEKTYLDLHSALKETYWGSRNFKANTISASEVIALREMPDETTELDDFDRYTVSVIRPTYEQIVVLQNEDDKEGTLLELGDVLLIAEKTKRDTSSGKDTLQVKAVSQADFGSIYQRVDISFFRPQFNPVTHGLRGTNKIASLYGAPFAEQFESIKAFNDKSFKAHFEDIKSQLELTFSQTLHNDMKKALLAGQDISAYDEILKQAKQTIGKDCADKLPNHYNEEYVIYVVRKLFKEDDFVKTLKETQGTEFFDKLVDDWATKAEAIALNPGQVRTAQNAMNPAALFNIHAGDRRKDLSVYASIAAGSVDVLKDALKTKMKTHLSNYFEEQTKDYTSYNLPLIGQRNKRKGLEKFLSALGY